MKNYNYNNNYYFYMLLVVDSPGLKAKKLKLVRTTRRPAPVFQMIRANLFRTIVRIIQDVCANHPLLKEGSR